MVQQATLFEEQKPRRKNGQYCTAEQQRVDRIENENKVLRLEREKYFRAYLAAASRNSRLERELTALKAKIKELTEQYG